MRVQQGGGHAAGNVGHGDGPQMHVGRGAAAPIDAGAVHDEVNACAARCATEQGRGDKPLPWEAAALWMT